MDSTLYDALSRAKTIAEVGPLLAELKASNRALWASVGEAKGGVGELRAQVDEALLDLQNAEYEAAMLRDEIRRCEQFQSIYQDVEVADLPREEGTDAHTHMLQRLQFELDERKR